MRYESVAEYLKTLTSAEREQYKDIISEAQERETNIYESRAKNEEALEGLKESFDRQGEAFNKLEESLANLQLAEERLNKSREVIEARQIYMDTTSLIRNVVKLKKD